MTHITSHTSDHEVLKQKICDAVTFGFLHSAYGTRRWNHSDRCQESEEDSLKREVRVVYSTDFRDEWLWGREIWLTRRSDRQDQLIAWTEDRSGRIVRGWYRHKTEDEARAYDTPGSRSCPGEAAWMPSIGAGLISFPAYPFQLRRDQHDDPRVAETVNNLQAIRPMGRDEGGAMTHSTTDQQWIETLQKRLKKFESLHWYAQQRPADDVEFWKNIPDSRKTEKLNTMARIEEYYPDDVDRLKCCECGDFANGFNIGVLSATHWVLAAIEEGIEVANKCYQEMDT